MSDIDEETTNHFLHTGVDDGNRDVGEDETELSLDMRSLMNVGGNEEFLQNLLSGSSSSNHLGEGDSMRARMNNPRNENGSLSTLPVQNNNNRPLFHGNPKMNGKPINFPNSHNHQPSIPSSKYTISSLQSFRETKSRHFIPYDIRKYIIFLYEEYVIQYPKATIIDISKAIYEHYIQYIDTYCLFQYLYSSVDLMVMQRLY